MFDLERALAAWRRGFAHHPRLFRDDLDELEAHLRDAVDARRAEGWTEQAAFEAALRELGDYGSTEAAYRAVFWAKARHRGRLRITWLREAYMLRNYLKIAWRHLYRHKGYTLLNVAGLAVGMACCLLVWRYVQHERGYDRHYERADRIYRLTRVAMRPDAVQRNANTAAAAGPVLQAEYPAVEAAVRFMFQRPAEILVRAGDAQFYEGRFYWTDSTVFTVFDVPLLRGDPRTALSEPQTVLLSRSTARKYFGDADPLGRVLTVDGWTTSDYTVTGVFEDVPAQTSLPFDVLASMAGEVSKYPVLFDGEGQWSNSLFYTYLLLREGADPEALAAELAPFAERHMGDFAASRGFRPSFELQPLTSIRLYSDLAVEPGRAGLAGMLLLFSIVAVFVLLLACVNFTNLSTARSVRRAREVGVRKVLGAHRRQLTAQFFGEALGLAVLAAVLAVGLAYLALPVLHRIAATSFVLDPFGASGLLPALVAVTLGTGLLAGGYPALVLSAYRPVAALKGPLSTGRRGRLLRQGLVVFQFVVTIVLLAGTFIVHRQLAYARSRPLGFAEDQVVLLPLAGASDGSGSEPMLDDVRRVPGVVQAAASAGVPGDLGLIDTFPIVPTDSATSVLYPMQIMGVDYETIETLGLELAAGRTFSRAYPTDADAAFILNETAAAELGWANPIGRRITLREGNGKTGTVIGVVRDFHLRSFHHAIEPTVLHLWPNRMTVQLVKVRPEGLDRTLAGLEAAWAAHAPDRPFEYAFLDEVFGRQYEAERRLQVAFGWLAGIAVFIAGMGLFGLAAYAVEQRTREIGVRKAMGATAAGIVGLFTGEITRLVGLAFLLAVPVSYLAMSRWLQGFAYSVSLGADVFLGAGALALLVALAAVGAQALRAARTDPARALRYE